MLNLDMHPRSLIGELLLVALQWIRDEIEERANRPKALLAAHLHSLGISMALDQEPVLIQYILHMASLARLCKCLDSVVESVRTMNAGRRKPPLSNS